MAVVPGQLQAVQAVYAVPIHWSDHDQSRRIAAADDADGLGRQRVPLLRRQLVVRLVQQLQDQHGRIVAIVFGNLSPEGQEPLAVPLGLAEDFLVMVHVHHRGEPAPEGLADRPVHTVEEFRINAKGAAVSAWADQRTGIRTESKPALLIFWK